MRRCVCALALALVFISCWPLIATAEECRRIPRARAAVLGAAAVESGDTAAAVAGSFGYRIDRCFGIEFEIGVVPDLQDDPQVVPLASSFPEIFGVNVRNPSVAPTIFPPPSFDSRLITFMTNARVEIPTTLRAIQPYVVGGGGVASVKREVTYQSFSSFTFTGTPLGSTPPPSLSLLSRSFSSTETALALNVGVGVSIKIVKQLFADADMRYMRVFTNQEFDLNRFGAGVSYRF